MSLKLTDEQLRQFEDEGYLFLPDVFGRSETDLLLNEAHEVFACDRKEVVRERDGRTARTAFAAQHYNEAYRRLARHPRLVRPGEQILGGDVYMHQFKINAKAAFDGDVWQWHQDYGVWSRDDRMPECRAMNIALFLEEVTEFNGALMFIPRSHKKGVLEAGHDVETTSYPLWTIDNATITRLVEEGWPRLAQGSGRLARPLQRQPGAWKPEQHVALRPDHRVLEPLPGGQPHPPLQAAGMGRPPRLHPHRMPPRRLPVDARAQGGLRS